MILPIPSEHIGRRLDKAASAILPGITRSQAQKMISNGWLVVNSNKVKSNYILKPSDCIELKNETVKKQAVPILVPDIIAETDDYIVLNKPAGLTVHPATHSTGATLVDFLISRYPALAKIGDDPTRPGIVHRLDKDASGAMVVAKNQGSFDSLKNQFKLRAVKKQYIILVHGRITPAEGEIRSHLSRSKKQFTRFASHTGAHGKEALTLYWIEKYYKKYSLVRVEPATGRTHQIRVHFFSRGYPIVGDRVYASKKILSRRSGAETAANVRESERLMLHAHLLGFKDRNGAWREYECAPGKDFADVIRLLAERYHSSVRQNSRVQC